MNGFIFNFKDKYFFIRTENTKKCKKIAKIFTNFFISKLKKDVASEIIENTYNMIYKNMYNAKIKTSNDFTSYFIHTKYSGETISKNDIVFIDA